MTIIKTAQPLYAIINQKHLVELRVNNVVCKNEALSFISTTLVNEPCDELQRNHSLALNALKELNFVDNRFQNNHVFTDKGDALKCAISYADEHVDDLIDNLMEGRQVRTALRKQLADCTSNG
jgi:hypothetical protein